MRELHLFAGAGGGILGGLLCGHSCVCAVEIEPYCREVLLQRQRDGVLPVFPIWDDVRTFDGNPWRGRVDVVCGGFPCQDISVAGKGAGIDGERSGLWGEMSRIIGEVRPRFAFVENSPALTARGLGRVLGDLAEMGYDARWGVVSAKCTGLHHERKRIWIRASDNHEDKHIRCGDSREQTENLSGGVDHEAIQKRHMGVDQLVSMGVACRANSIPDARRIFNGVASGMDRLAAIGNGQVPAVAHLAWSLLKQG